MFSIDIIANGNFILLRPIFITLFALALTLFLLLVYKSHLVNGWYLLFTSTAIMLVAGQLLYFQGVIVDEFALDGDPFITYFTLATVLLCIINPLYFFIQPVEKREA
ncbi:hypothetical protein EQV77_04605 [Halobacillus fulvus]|nr:hypothetical protein EQV77_04605 [Halobacillus fulvus]